MNLRKILLTLLSLALVTMLLMGCGNTGSTEETNNKQESEIKTETTSESESENAVENETESAVETESENETETLTEIETESESETESETTLSLYDIAFVGDSRTLTMAKGGRLEFDLLPASLVFATWGGKVSDAVAHDNALRAAQADKPVAIFWYGINDAQSAPSIREDVQGFCNRYLELIQVYQKANPDSQIVVLSILTTSVNEKDYYPEQNDMIARYNQAIEELCKQESYTYLDISHLYHGEEDFHTGDNIHFSIHWYVDYFLPCITEELNIQM